MQSRKNSRICEEYVGEKNYGIHWFRRDLRVAGNPALQENWKKHQGRVVGFFCFDPVFLSRKDFSANRFQFFLNTLENLSFELKERGSDLLVLDEGPQKAFDRLFETLKEKKAILPSTVSFNRDYEPFAVDRDKKMAEYLSKQGLEIISERDHLLIEPSELLRERKPYQVFTPFRKKWMDLLSDPLIQRRVHIQKKGLDYLDLLEKGKAKPLFSLTWDGVTGNNKLFVDKLKKYQEENQKKVTISIPLAGSLPAYEKVKEFKKRVQDYGTNRDIPSVSGTSGLSIYLKNGSFTVAQITASLGLEAFGKKEGELGSSKYLSELIWREFYYHIIAAHPRVEHESFNPKYKNIKWQNRQSWFQAWKEGKTGFPIVDAGMRQLNQTGWMHNRVRMVVASFLTKDLLIDWRWGENYFMEKLLDGDLAPNNGGWQWAASTGCDPQPYFRIFNPWLQSAKFDPEGVYIKKYIPELRKVPAKLLHQPPENSLPGYFSPIIEHSIQKEEALKLYKGE
jgi:deoxyribodipyrimidine photo-lyase